MRNTSLKKQYLNSTKVIDTKLHLIPLPFFRAENTKSYHDFTNFQLKHFFFYLSNPSTGFLKYPLELKKKFSQFILKFFFSSHRIFFSVQTFKFVTEFLSQFEMNAEMDISKNQWRSTGVRVIWLYHSCFDLQFCIQKLKINNPKYMFQEQT